MPGYINLDRDHFFGDAIAKEDRCYTRQDARIDLYVRAAHSTHSQLVGGKLIHLKLGEQIASERYLEKRWNWSRTKVRSFIKVLQEIGELDHRKDQGETILILCKYEDLTRPPEKKEPATIPEGNQRRTRREPKDKQLEEGYQLETPLIPQGGDEGNKRKVLPVGAEKWPLKKQKTTRVNINNARMIRIGKFFNREADTLWTVEEAVTLSRINPSESEIATVEEFYLAIIPNEEDYRRHELITLLNNWNGEHDKAVLWKNSK